MLHFFLNSSEALNATAIGILLLLLIFCLFLYKHHSRDSNAKEPPTVSGSWPIIGHLHLFFSTSRTPHRTLGALADTYGPLYTIKLGDKKVVVLSNNDMAEECFTKNDIVVSSRPKVLATEHLAYNQAMLGLAPYPYWRELKKIATLHILSNRRVDQLRHVRVSEVQNSIKELFCVWSSKKNEQGYALVELRQWFSQLTFNMVLGIVAGKRYFGATNVEHENAQKWVKALREFMRLLGIFIVADAVPWLRWFDFGGHEKSMKEVAHELDVLLGEWLEEHRQNRTIGKKGDQDQDFMDSLLSLLDGTTIEGIDADTIIKSTALAMIAGGTDTSIVVLTWAICLILRNPRTLEKAKAELDIKVGKERFIDESDIYELEYLRAIVKETLRLYPPGPLSGTQEFTEDCTLGGYNIRKGTQLITNLWKIQTDPNVWGDDSLEFKPERFLTTHKDVDVRGQNFELLPFGSGRRSCPGISFGLQIVHLTLAT